MHVYSYVSRFRLGRKWSKLHVYFDAINRRIFFLGAPSEKQAMTFVLPISSNEQLTVDELFQLRSALAAAVPSGIGDQVQR